MPIKDLTGQRFGALTVLEFGGYDDHERIQWKCQCDCGNTCVKLGTNITQGFTSSCGRKCKVSGWKPIEYEDKTILGIPLTQGAIAIIDREDFDKIKHRNWHLSKDHHGQDDTGAAGYARAQQNGKSLKMHRVIMNCPDGMEIDHKDHNRLNNRKNNLRICTSQDNAHNRRKFKSSQYKGVTFNKHFGYYRAHISISIGTYLTAEEAAHAYDKKAKELFGEFAYLNFPDLKELYKCQKQIL